MCPQGGSYTLHGLINANLQRFRMQTIKNKQAGDYRVCCQVVDHTTAGITGLKNFLEYALQRGAVDVHQGLHKLTGSRTALGVSNLLQLIQQARYAL